jgi:hypothetical protein
MALASAAESLTSQHNIQILLHLTIYRQACDSISSARNWTSTYFKSRRSSPFAVACSAVDSPLRDLLAPYQAAIPSVHTLFPISISIACTTYLLSTYAIKKSQRESRRGNVLERVSQTLPRHIEVFICRVYEQK